MSYFTCHTVVLILNSKKINIIKTMQKMTPKRKKHKKPTTQILNPKKIEIYPCPKPKKYNKCFFLFLLFFIYIYCVFCALANLKTTRPSKMQDNPSFPKIMAN